MWLRFMHGREDVSHNYIKGTEQVTCPQCGHGLHHFCALSGPDLIVTEGNHMSTMKQRDIDTANRIIQDILTAIPHLKVCNASASPTGKYIQARVTWTENGKIVIGYYSINISTTNILPKTNQYDLIASIFRIQDRIFNAVEAYNIPRNTPYDSDESVYKITALIRNKIFNTFLLETYSCLVPICDEIDRKLKETFTSGVQFSNNRTHIKKQAKKKLMKTLDEILSAGVTDEEIQGILEEAIVKYIHKL